MSFIISYLSWHYSRALLNIRGIFANFLWATYRFFSIPLLIKTFFAPWRRLDNQYDKKASLEGFFGTFIVNILMRLVGMFIKFVVLMAGFFSLLLLSIFEIIFFLFWIILPFIIVWMFYAGILKLFK